MADEKFKEMEKEISGIKFKFREMNGDQALSLAKYGQDKEMVARKSLEMIVVEPKIDKEFLKKITANTLAKLSIEVAKFSGAKEDFQNLQEDLLSGQIGTTDTS